MPIEFNTEIVDKNLHSSRISKKPAQSLLIAWLIKKGFIKNERLACVFVCIFVAVCFVFSIFLIYKTTTAVDGNPSTLRQIVE